MEINLNIIKRDGSIVGFDKSKIEDAILKAMKYGSGIYEDKVAEKIEEIAENLREELLQRKNEEIARKQTCVGPHRDDIKLMINNTDATKYSSQGQQRTLILALKLAELEMLQEKTGEPPILLLDDVLAELDDMRQNYLLKSIEGNIQTILTSVDTLLFDNKFLETVQLIRVENGNIIS